MTVYAIRHEERGASATFDDMLTPEGRRRAATIVCNAIRALHIRCIYSSPYPRCIQTVLPASWSECVPLIVDNSLFEHVNTKVPGEHDTENYLHSLTRRELQLVGAVHTHKHLESLEDIRVDDNELLRLKEFLEYVSAMHGTDNVLVCTHGDCINKMRGMPFGTTVDFGEIIDITPV